MTRLLDNNRLLSTQVINGCLVRCWQPLGTEAGERGIFWMVHTSAGAVDFRSAVQAHEWARCVADAEKPYRHKADGPIGSQYEVVCVGGFAGSGRCYQVFERDHESGTLELLDDRGENHPTGLERCKDRVALLVDEDLRIAAGS